MAFGTSARDKHSGLALGSCIQELHSGLVLGCRNWRLEQKSTVLLDSFPQSSIKLSYVTSSLIVFIYSSEWQSIQEYIKSDSPEALNLEFSFNRLVSPRCDPHVSPNFRTAAAFLVAAFRQLRVLVPSASPEY